MQAKLNDILTSQGRMEEQILAVREDIAEIKQKQQEINGQFFTVCEKTKQHESWIAEHTSDHKGYFKTALAVAGVVTAVLTLLLNAIFGIFR